jgi:hypothetical protein
MIKTLERSPADFKTFFKSFSYQYTQKYQKYIYPYFLILLNG